MEAAIRPGAPLPHERLLGSGYGTVLALILVSLGFQLAVTDSGWTRFVVIVLQSLTLLAALHVSGVRAWIIRGAAALAALACLSAAGIEISSEEVGEVISRTVSLMLVVLAPAAIVLGIARHYRTHGLVTMTTMFGVLCVYLLLGMAFAFVFGLIAAIEPQPFFASGVNGDQSDYLYFSLASLTTTGYGDFTAGTGLGRSFSITEALIGQIYLVTVVALIVGNIRREPG